MQRSENQKIKVLFFLPSFWPGGAERMLITFMNNIDRNKFSPEFIVLDEDGTTREWIYEDVPIYSFGHRRIKGSIFKLISFIRHHKPDVIFTTMVHCNALALLMKVFFPKIRVVVREASLPSVIVRKYGIKGFISRFVYKFMYPFADVVIDNCSQVLDQFADDIKTPIDNHVILYNPVDVERIYAQIPEKFEPFAGRETTLCFVSVGRLCYEKGYDRLIRALVGFDPGCNWRLDIVGEGKYRADLEVLIAECGLQDRVILRGYYSNPWEIAAQADCLLLPSRWEGMPNVVLEGFACGVPAIAMKEAGGINDIAKYTSEEQLRVVDTIEAFVEGMKDIQVSSVVNMRHSILPKQFLLGAVMGEFEALLRGDKI